MLGNYVKVNYKWRVHTHKIHGRKKPQTIWAGIYVNDTWKIDKAYDKNLQNWHLKQFRLAFAIAANLEWKTWLQHSLDWRQTFSLHLTDMEKYTLKTAESIPVGETECLDFKLQLFFQLISQGLPWKLEGKLLWANFLRMQYAKECKRNNCRTQNMAQVN